MKESIELVNFNNKIPLSFSLVRFDNIIRHCHPINELILVLEGDCTITIEDETFNMKSDDMIIVNPFTFHSLQANKYTTVVSVLIDSIGFGVEANDATVLEFNLNTVKKPINKKYEDIRYLIFSIIKYNAMENVNEIYTNRAITYSFFAQLINDFSIKKDKSKNDYLKSYDTIQEITSYIKDNYQKNITLSFLSEHFTYSIAYLSRLFKTSLGKSFTDYYDGLRLDHCVSDLITTNKTIEEIALSNGFDGPRSFVRVFKKTYKYYPSDYRKRFIKNQDKFPEEASLIRKEFLKKILEKYENTRIKRKDKAESVRDYEQIVNIDFNSKGLKNKKNYLSILELSESFYILDVSTAENLKKIQKEIGFKYLSIDNLFNLVNFSTQKNSSIKINYVYFDHTINFLKSINLLPYIKISFDDSKYKEAAFLEVLDEIFKHISSYFPENEVKNWMFSFSFSNKKLITSNLMLSFYNKFLEYFKSSFYVSPSFYKDALIDNDEFSDYIKFSKKYNIKNDFYSILFLNEKDDKVLSTEKDELKNLFSTLKEKNLFFEDKMLIEKISFTNNKYNLLNDTLFLSSYLTKNLIDNIRSVAAFSNSSLSDYNDSNLTDLNFFHGGNGLFTYNSIKKASYNAYYLFSLLGSELIKKDSSYLITKDENKIIILVNNYVHYSNLFAKNEYFDLSIKERYGCFPKMSNIFFHFLIDNLNFEEAKIKTYTINKTSGSSFDKWLSQGAYNKLDEEETLLLRRLSSMDYNIETKKIDKKSLEFNFKIAPLETALFIIEFK